jgi:molecular chaperone DnaK
VCALAVAQLIHSTEKLLSENKSKLDAADVTSLEKQIGELREAREKDDLTALRAKISAVQQESMKIGQAMYKNAGAGAGSGSGSGAGAEGATPSDDSVKDADFKDKDEKKP